MHVRIIHMDRRWDRAQNHMDARHCPDCGATVHGKRGQQAHAQWHIELDEHLSALSARTGITEEQVEIPARWTATVMESVGGSVDTLGDEA